MTLVSDGIDMTTNGEAYGSLPVDIVNLIEST